MIGLGLVSAIVGRRHQVDQARAERLRQGWVLDDYRSGEPLHVAGPNVFCYTLYGRISGFEGFEGQDGGTRVIIEGSDRKSYEAAARAVRINRYDIVVADCLVRDHKQPILNDLVQNLVCGEATRRMHRAYRPSERGVVSVVGANDGLINTLSATYGNYGLDFVAGREDFGLEYGKRVIDIGLARRDSLFRD